MLVWDHVDTFTAEVCTVHSFRPLCPDIISVVTGGVDLETSKVAE